MVNVADKGRINYCKSGYLNVYFSEWVMIMLLKFRQKMARPYIQVLKSVKTQTGRKVTML
jgi:hypothetical protein